MNFEEMFMIVIAMVLGAALIGSAISAIAKHRGQSLSLLEEALRSQTLDAQTKQLITRALVRQPLLTRLWGGGKLLLAVGWVAMFMGIGFLISGERDMVEAAFPLGFIGFAMVSLPFALRELEGRKHAHE